MCCNRSINRSGECGQVMGTSGSQTIALRGPGCISGTGRCEGVAGTGGDCDCDCDCDCCCCRCGCDNVGGTGGRRCNNVAGTGGNRRCNNFVGNSGRRCSNVGGTGRGRGCWDICDWCLGTPTVVPR